MWRCTKLPTGAPKRPRAKLLEKLRWPTGTDKKENELVLGYMKEVVQRTWDQRYPDWKREMEKKEEATKRKEKEAAVKCTRKRRAAQELELFLEEEAAAEQEEDEEGKEV